MDKIVAVTFDIAQQECVAYNALEWHNFIADTREQASEYGEEAPAALDELFDEVYGDEFWFDLYDEPYSIYQLAFDLRSEEFIICQNDSECAFLHQLHAGGEDEIFWA